MEPEIINDYLYNRGRGVELRGSRITVNDLWPYLQHADYSDTQMLEIWTITQDQLDALKQYIAANREAVAEENARIDARIAREVAEQQAQPWHQEMIARHERRRPALLAWSRQLRKHPELKLMLEGESSEEYRKRMNEAFTEFRQINFPEYAEVGS